MGAPTKRPIQVYLEERQYQALRALAEAQNMSIVELVRRGIDLLLAELPIEDDPAMRIVSLGRSNLGDLAEKHDEYLTQFSRVHHSP